jgi:DNA end-binding protein Ku
MPRAIWSGSITFGLVNVPVRMFSAVDEQDLHFNLLHEPDSGRIGYQKICKAENEPVPDDEIVKAFEVSKGELVVLDDDDFEAVKAEGVRSIEITDFVPYEEIDPIYFERTYYLGPQSGAEGVYALLLQAMERTGLAAIAKYVMRDKQHLGCLRVHEGVIVLERMFFHDEIRAAEEIAPEKARVGKRELEMAASLIGQLTGSFEPERYEDTYRHALLDVIRAKRKGKAVSPPREEAQEEEPTDLLAALRASVSAAKGDRGARSSAKPKRGTSRTTSSRRRASSRRR